MAGFQQVRVLRDLEFKGVASHTGNVKGNMSPERMTLADYFCDDTTSALWTETLDGTNDDIAPTAGGYPGLTLLSGDTDNQVSFLGSALIFDISNNPVIETKVRLTDISQTSFFFGFSDANTETTPASTIDYADGTLAAAATDACGFVSDADKSSSQWYAASIATGGSVTGTATGITPTDATYVTLRVALDSSGNATFYINGVPEHYEATAVTDVPLCAIFNFGTRDNGGGDNVYVKYFRAWQDI